MSIYSYLPIDTLLVERDNLKEKITEMGFKDKWTIADNQQMNKWRMNFRLITEEIKRQEKVQQEYREKYREVRK